MKIKKVNAVHLSKSINLGKEKFYFSNKDGYEIVVDEPYVIISYTKTGQKRITSLYNTICLEIDE